MVTHGDDRRAIDRRYSRTRAIARSGFSAEATQRGHIMAP